MVFATSLYKYSLLSDLSIMTVRICLNCLPTSFHLDNQRQADITYSVPPSHYKQVSEY